MAADDAVALESLRARFPTLARVESVPQVAAPEVALIQQAPVRVEETFAEIRQVAAAGRGGSGAAPQRPQLRADARVRPVPVAPVKQKDSSLNTFWPAGPRRDPQPAVAQAAVQGSRPNSPKVVNTPSPLPPAVTNSAELHGGYEDSVVTGPVSVLKSGVVEGMAYKLYSDGSIEAELPQGILRFGSIAALRSHIENTP
jgi:hypothetical protein